MKNLLQESLSEVLWNSPRTTPWKAGFGCSRGSGRVGSEGWSSGDIADVLWLQVRHIGLKDSL